MITGEQLEHYVSASTLAQALGISRSRLFQLVRLESYRKATIG